MPYTEGSERSEERSQARKDDLSSPKVASSVHGWVHGASGSSSDRRTETTTTAHPALIVPGPPPLLRRDRRFDCTNNVLAFCSWPCWGPDRGR
jgi:hypothetical protein